MSLHKFAEQVASQGRGDDSLLVHMTPDEVQRLQKFAQANGTSLTINPTTGLPEAGMLSDLFKTIAPIALGAFLGPAGMGISFGGMSSALSAGIATGGITALATGSLSRGLMAGLGAYGGAGLGEGLMGAATATDAFQAAQSNLGPEANAMSVRDVAATANINPLTTGVQALGTEQGRAAALNAMGGTKGALTTAGMVAAPLMAMQPTTKMPETKSTGNIRQFDYNINPDTGKPDPLYGMRAMAPVKASEFGDKTFQGQRELFRQQNPNPYELGVGSLNQVPQQQPLQQQPPRMNTGGIVALADGGDVVRMADGTPPAMLSDEALYQKTGSWEAAAAARDAQNNALNAFNNQQAAAARDTAANATNAANFAKNPDASDWWEKQPGGVNALYDTINKQLAATPNMTDAQVDAAMKQYGISNEDVAAALRKGGGSQAEEYALLAGNMGLSGINTNINDYIAKARLDPTFKAKTGLEQQAAARAAMGTVNMNDADVFRATGKTVAELFPSTLTKPVQVVPGETQLPGATTYANGAFGNYGSGPATGVDYRGNTVSIATPGDIITNPDDSRTVVPNIPGRPYGGFTGSEGVKSAYTAGGGSLGYTAKAPKTVEEFNTLYNKQTGDSLAAYDYLMGKGGGKYPVKSGVPNIAVPYGEAVLGKKTTKPVAKTTGTTGTTKVLNSDGTVNETETDKANFDYAAYLKANPDVQAELDKGVANFGTKDDLASAAYNHYIAYGKAQNRPLRAAEGGMMGYAMGGGLGSLGYYSDGGRLLKGPGDGVSDSIPATIGAKSQPARLADGEFVVPARIVSELGNGSTDAGAKKLYAMMDRVQRARGKTTGKNKVAANSRADKYLPA